MAAAAWQNQFDSEVFCEQLRDYLLDQLFYHRARQHSICQHPLDR